MTSGARAVPEWLWAPIAAGLASLILGATGIWAGMPWLVPSLGPTIFLQAHDSDQRAARPYNVVLGHALGVAAAVIAVRLTGADTAPPVLASNALIWPRVWAATIAMALTLLAQAPLKAGHPPAAATALLIALGGLSLAWRDMAVIATGVLIAALLGEILRRLRASKS